MPEWIQPFAENQPMTVVVNAVRDLTLGLNVGTYTQPAILWCVGHPAGRLPARALALQPAHDPVGRASETAGITRVAGVTREDQTCGTRPSRLKTTKRTASTMVRRKSVRSIPRRLR